MQITLQRALVAVIPLLFAGFCAYGNSGPYGKLPLSFEPNLGQTTGDVQWLARGADYTLFLSGHDAVLEMGHVSLTPAAAGGRCARDAAVVSSTGIWESSITSERRSGG